MILATTVKVRSGLPRAPRHSCASTLQAREMARGAQFLRVQSCFHLSGFHLLDAVHEQGGRVRFARCRLCHEIVIIGRLAIS